MITKDENNYFTDDIKQNLKSKPKSNINIKNSKREEINKDNNNINNMNINSPGLMNNNFNQNMNMNMMNNNNFMQNMQFPNMMMTNNYYPMNNMNNMMMNNNFIPNINTFGISDEEEWMKGFKMAVDDINKDVDDFSGPKMQLIFKTTQGTTHVLTVKTELTIDELLKTYLIRVEKPNLIKDNRICFLYNARQLKYGDNTSVDNFFKNASYPKIYVNDDNNLIG